MKTIIQAINIFAGKNGSGMCLFLAIGKVLSHQMLWVSMLSQVLNSSAIPVHNANYLCMENVGRHVSVCQEANGSCK